MGKFCDWYTAEIHLFKIQRQIMWLLHQRFICLNLKLYSAIFDYTVEVFEQKNMFYEVWSLIILNQMHQLPNQYNMEWLILIINTVIWNMQYIFILWKNSNWAGILYLHTHDQTTNNSHEQLQKQPPEVFCSVLFIKKETVAQVFSLWILQNF